jgi:P-type Cu2+ transporter
MQLNLCVCTHCGNEVPARRGPSTFCCAGCESVYHLLKARGLDQYYELRAKSGHPQVSPPEITPDESFAYLDQSEFLELYAQVTSTGSKTMNFYLEGAHCAACVWLTEQIQEFVPEIQSARLSLGDSVARVTIRPNGSFSSVAREYARMGYRPHPVRADEADALSRSEDRWLLARAGVAGACAGNIMLLAVSLYAGADGNLARAFRWTSFGLSLPVLLFSAYPFYRGAWSAVRSRRATIDLPIALGIALGGASSVYNLSTGSAYLYFDSLSTLVFLMLSSRYLLIRTQRAATHTSKLIRFLTPAVARLRNPKTGAFQEVSVDRVRHGDEVEVLTSEVMPVDGVVLQGRSVIDQSLLTGESLPKSTVEGDVVFAGTINREAPLLIRATAAGGATRLGQAMRAVEEDLSKKAPIVSFSDRIARAFVAAVLVAVAVIFLIGLRQGLDIAVNLALALSIVTCPCAFALATPLAMSVSMGRCARQGVLIKDAEALERLSRIKEILFDKTGTLTLGKLEVSGWDHGLPLETDTEFLSAILALESRSRHPVAKALLAHFESRNISRPELTGFKEIVGTGVKGIVDGRSYELRANPTLGIETAIGVWRDGMHLGNIRFSDRLRENSPGVFRTLAEMGYKLSLLSGDAVNVVAQVATSLGLARTAWHAERGPEGKRREVVARSHALMVGDGANDAAALAAAYASIAVHGGVEISLRSADVYCRKPGVGAIPPLLTIARETMWVIRRNFGFSIVYNLIGIIGVIFGWVTPLFAAVLMPISALTVFGSSMVGTRKLRMATRALGRA